MQNLTWAIADDARLGFVGPNGAGKSTILNLLAGRLLPDRGFMVTAKGASVGYLPQEVRLDPQRSVLAEAMTASARLAAIEADLEQIARRLEEPSVYGDERGADAYAGTAAASAGRIHGGGWLAVRQHRQGHPAPVGFRR
ncbi:ATP-binding cassette domain-containing protein [Candidatus Amarolinea dominans]|uniref:ATP-binding cassette domain-containing protein n=1 Tax=Candidatus Amarolinea dominans TaxID=3140696 RepID=UPI0031CC76A3